MSIAPEHRDPRFAGLDDAIALLRAIPDHDALLHCIIKLVQRWTGCDSVGVRLSKGKDYPYYTTHGFPEAFVLAENSLCRHDATGNIVCNVAGHPCLECLCGAVIDGRTDASLPFFTVGGSFFTGSTSRLLTSESFAHLALGTRNRCMQAGYETVVLTPLREAGQTLGLLQVNDPRRDCLDKAGVEALERLASGLAVLLSRQAATAALAEAEARYRAMFFANIAIKILVDPETGRIVEANPAACAFYGYSAEALREMFIWDINTLDREAVQREMQAARERGKRVFRFSHRLADGAVREVEVYSGPVEFCGRTLLFSIIHDVTARVRAEEARERVEQMLRHDLRSPLAGIVGLTGHLAEVVQDPDSLEMVEVIRDTAQRVYDLVERNLNLLKIEQGRYTLDRGPVPMAQLLQQLARESSPLADRRGVILRLGGPGLDQKRESPLASGEAGLLATMLSNLVTNALEAAPSGTAVTAELSETVDWVLISLHNQGVIPKDIRRQFFTKYATCGKEGGTGLGAYIARSIARLHEGDIDWETNEITGTRLTVRLPVFRFAPSDQSV